MENVPDSLLRPKTQDRLLFSAFSPMSSRWSNWPLGACSTGAAGCGVAGSWRRRLDALGGPASAGAFDAGLGG